MFLKKDKKELILGKPINYISRVELQKLKYVLIKIPFLDFLSVSKKEYSSKNRLKILGSLNWDGWKVEIGKFVCLDMVKHMRKKYKNWH